MKKKWPFSFNFLYFAAFSSFIPFFVLFYQSLGFSGTQIGLLAGMSPLILLVGMPLGTSIADSTNRHKLIMGLGLGGSIVVALVLLRASSFLWVFVLMTLFNFFLSPVGALGDSATMNMLGDQKSMYGRIRLGGTIGWGLFAPIAGAFVDARGLSVIFWMYAAIMLINLAVSQKFVFGNAGETPASNSGGIWVLLRDPRWIFFLSAAFLGGLGISSVVSYLYPYMAEMGASETMMGLASTLATSTELLVFFFGDRLIKRFKPSKLFVISMFFVGIRSLLFAAASTPLLVLFVQLFSGLVFPAMWLASVSYADELAPVGSKSTAQGLLGGVTYGIGSAIGGFVGGLLLETIGGRGLFLVFGIIILTGLILIEIAKRLFPEKRTVSLEM